MTYRVVFDNGKPYEEKFISINAVEQALREFYEKNKGSDYPFDCRVYEQQEVDITESQLIDEIIGDILDEVGE